MKSVVADSGYFVALFDETHPLHRVCRDFLRSYHGRFLTTEAVITETMARLSVPKQLRCLEWLANASQAGLLLVDREPLDFRYIENLTRRYGDRPMDFADASIVGLTSRSGVREILTADRRDFAVYRMGRRTRFVDVLAG